MKEITLQRPYKLRYVSLAAGLNIYRLLGSKCRSHYDTALLTRINCPILLGPWHPTIFKSSSDRNFLSDGIHAKMIKEDALQIPYRFGNVSLIVTQ